MRIALTGPAYSGKTTLADYLEEHCGWTKLNYTDRITIDVAKALSAVRERPVTVDEIMRDKEKHRPILKALSAYLGYNQGYGVKDLLQEYEAQRDYSERELVVWDCVRYERQADILVDAGFVIVEMEVEVVTQQTRAFAKGITAEKLEELMGLEADEGVIPDMKLDGAAHIAELADALMRLAGLRHRPKPVETPLDIYIRYNEPDLSIRMN